MSKKIKDRLEISIGEINKAKKRLDRTVEKEFQGEIVRIVFSGLTILDRPKLIQIKHKIKKRVGLTRKELKFAIKAGLLSKEEAWFWTTEWQIREQEADEAIRKGEVFGPFESMEELIKALKNTTT